MMGQWYKSFDGLVLFSEIFLSLLSHVEYGTILTVCV